MPRYKGTCSKPTYLTADDLRFSKKIDFYCYTMMTSHNFHFDIAVYSNESPGGSASGDNREKGPGDKRPGDKRPGDKRPPPPSRTSSLKRGSNPPSRTGSLNRGSDLPSRTGSLKKGPDTCLKRHENNIR